MTWCKNSETSSNQGPFWPTSKLSKWKVLGWSLEQLISWEKAAKGLSCIPSRPPTLLSADWHQWDSLSWASYYTSFIITGHHCWATVLTTLITLPGNNRHLCLGDSKVASFFVVSVVRHPLWKQVDAAYFCCQRINLGYPDDAVRLIATQATTRWASCNAFFIVTVWFICALAF